MVVVEKKRCSLSMKNEQADAGRVQPNPSCETKFSGAKGDRGISFFPVQLTTTRIGCLTRLIHTLLHVMTIYTYIHIIYYVQVFAKC